jgi:hypothetical protein
MISEIDIKDFPNSWKPSTEPCPLVQANLNSVVTFPENPLMPWLVTHNHKAVTTCINAYEEIYKSDWNSTLVTVWVKD